MALLCVLSIFSPVYAVSENEEKSQDLNLAYEYFEKAASPELPGGYKLTDVTVDVYYNNELAVESGLFSNANPSPAEPNGLVYKIKNVNHTNNEYMLVNDYESDYFYGPCTVSETYTQSRKANLSCKTSIGNSTLQGAIG